MKKIAVLTAVSVVCFVIGVIGIVLAIVGFSQKGSSGPVAAGGSEGGGSVIDVTNDGTKVFLSGFEFVMPKGYDYEVREEDGMEILGYSDNSGYFAMTSYRNDISFSAVKNRMNLLADEYSKAYGRTVVGNKRTVDDVEMVYFDLGVVEDVNVVFVYSDADLRTFETAILTDIGVDGTQYFNNVAKILKTAKKKTEMNKSINGAGFEDVNLPRITVEIEE